jgi:uncharacterized protein
MGKIKLTPKVEFPAAEIATEVTAAIGIRGSGKSNVLGVIAEDLLDQGIQVVVLDPVGLWFSLRLDADGKSPSGLNVAVLGGRHGEIPLLPSAGRVVATALARSGRSAVLDVSGFSKADRCRFAADFAEQLLRDKKEHQGPLWLVLEEAQTFCPQVIRHGLEYMGRMLGAFEEMAEVGRNFGLGLGLATQRPQKVNKEVLNLAENVLAFRLLGALERKAVRDWLMENDAPGRSEVDGMLPSLNKGEALIWSPVRGIFEQAGTPKKETYDAGATPLAAREKVQVGALDLGALHEAMAQVVADVEANDPRKLRARIAELERQVMDATQRTAVAHAQAAPRGPVIVEVCPVGAIAALRRARVHLERACTETRENLEALTQRVKEILDSEVAWQGERDRALQDGPAAATPLPPGRGGKRAPGANGAAGGGNPSGGWDARLPTRIPPTPGLDHPVVGAGALRILQALARSHRPLTWPQARMLAGMVDSGTSGGYRSQLLKDDLMREEGGVLLLTPAGRARAGQVGLQATGRELLELWKRELPGKAGDMLQVLVDHGATERQELISAVGMKDSGTSGGYVSLLLTYGLAEKEGAFLRASGMFMEGP